MLDVGGGNGELAFQLQNLNRCPATVVDPRPLRLRRYARKAAFGMYTKNKVLSRYNHPDLPAGCVLSPESLVSPAHLRVLFEVPGGSTGRRCLPPHVPAPPACAAHSVAAEPTANEPSPPPVPHALLEALCDQSTYGSAVAQAKATAWTRKGLVHEADDDTQAEAGQAEDDGQVDEGPGEAEVTATDDVHGDEEDSISAAAAPGEAQVPKEQSPPDLVDREAICDALAPTRDLDFDEAALLVAGCSVVVGLHPDQAAAEIVAFAAERRIPFAVVPCCVYGYYFPQRRLPGGRPVRTYDDLVAWCLANGPPGTKVAELDFEGKNKVVFWAGD